MRSLMSAALPVEVRIPCGSAWLPGDLTVPVEFIGLVVFADAGPDGRHNACSRRIAHRLHDAGIATLLFNPLTATEAEAEGHRDPHRPDVALLTRRLELATAWAAARADVRGMPLGFLAKGAGSAAALIAAAQLGPRVSAIVAHSGRPELAGAAALGSVSAPTLLIGGHEDPSGLARLERVLDLLGGVKRLAVVPRAGTHLDHGEPLEQVGDLAAAWFSRHLLRTEQLA